MGHSAKSPDESLVFLDQSRLLNVLISIQEKIHDQDALLEETKDRTREVDVANGKLDGKVQIVQMEHLDAMDELRK